MKKIHKLHIAYNTLLYRIGIRTPLMYTMFRLPLSISICIALVSLCMGFFPIARAYGIGVMGSCVALVIGVRLILALLQQRSSLTWTLFLMNCKVLGFALFFVICYAMFNMSIFILLLGFITPLCILIIHICKVYVFTTTVKEV